MVDFIIREARASDVSSIAKFQIEMAFETENISLEPLVVKAGVEHIFKNPQIGRYVVAEVFGTQKIIASTLILSEWSDWRNAEVWWIHSVYVAQDFRSQGVFRKIYDFIRGQVETKKNIRGLRLYVEKHNRKAQAVYQKLGMSNNRYDMYEWMRDY